jgi:m7GpppX diphosphatase
MYAQVVKPYIESFDASRLQWVYNILEGKAEQEHVLFQDEHFLLMPDLKWDGKNMESLYLMAIVKERGLASLRDLNASHVTFLKHIRQTIAETVPKHYPGVSASQLRVFFHYQPSYCKASCELLIKS